jgi:hypothetical protein
MSPVLRTPGSASSGGQIEQKILRRTISGRSLDYRPAGDENRRLCSLWLGLMDRTGVQLESFGDATTRLAGL